MKIQFNDFTENRKYDFEEICSDSLKALFQGSGNWESDFKNLPSIISV